jgi:hypothetical protein
MVLRQLLAEERFARLQHFAFEEYKNARGKHMLTSLHVTQMVLVHFSLQSLMLVWKVSDLNSTLYTDLFQSWYFNSIHLL